MHRASGIIFQFPVPVDVPSSASFVPSCASVAFFSHPCIDANAVPINFFALGRGSI